MLCDLYQELVLDHGRNPRNHRVIDGATHSADGFNPLCGDRIHVYLHVDGDAVRDVSFQGSGCAISQASASLMTQSLKGRSVAEAEALFEKFHALVTGQSGAPSPRSQEELGKLAVFEGVQQFPMRVKCASLAWHTMRSALRSGTAVSTE